ncbi:hypothetical protein WN55_06130 [Dufourea novaeangliae]|uniref:DUF4771 domain-containing protein n=1 Tax=Dufourea novaeangliae TaxID=178035 RepID=A0A154P1Y8_DUFNO|nr:hypothetical protein WN55_06130 [Dufourea novaeangliae]
MIIKPYDFCCSSDNIDPLTQYDQKENFFNKSSLMSMNTINESPVLKFRTHFTGYVDSELTKKSAKAKPSDIEDSRRKLYTKQPVNKLSKYTSSKLHIRAGSSDDDLCDKQTNKVKEGPIQWYLEDEIRFMKNLMMLQCVIQQDCEEMVTGRTQRTLAEIGAISTFFMLTPDIIKKLQEICNSIAFLTLPEAIVELHERLPSVIMPKIIPKPVPPTSPIRQKKESPYEEDLFLRPDWVSYYNKYEIWQAKCQLIPIPKVILPPKECLVITSENTRVLHNNDETKVQRKAGGGSFIDDRSDHIRNNPILQKKQKQTTSIKEEGKNNLSRNIKQKNPTLVKKKETVKKQKRESITGKDIIDNNDDNAKQEVDAMNKPEFVFDIPELPNGSKVFDFTINGISEKSGPVEYKICGVLQPPQLNKKSWLGEKHAHYVISGAADDPPSCPVTYEMTGIANITPVNSNEKFFAILKLGDGPKKIYPSGRKNLSPKWQEWLQSADEEYRKAEREANKLIKNIGAITRLVFPGLKCDSCCSCRQSRKSYLKSKETKTPYFVIDTIAEDSKKNKCIIGSMAMHSPAPTPPESTVNLLEVIASEDVLTSKLMINGVTNPKGETQYFISGIKEEIIHQPSRVIERPPPRPPRNVPPCECAIQQISAKGLTTTVSHDHIPWTKEDGLCFGKKFRPGESPAFSCKMYPGDKSCRRNPFFREITKMKKRAEKASKKATGVPEKKRMYSIADFQPCGDEHGMGICGAPWGTLHTLTPQELEEQEKLRKEILRGPPCGTKPGRAVCKGPFGERIPFKKPKIDLQELPGEFDDEDIEDEEEEEKVEKKPVMVMREKEKKRDKKCKQMIKEKQVKQFIPDPTYPGYDDPWNIYRTAPTEKESETDFKALLKLSSPKPSALPVESKLLLNNQKDRQKSVVSLNKNQSPKKPASGKLKTNEEAPIQGTKSVDTKDTQNRLPDKVLNPQKAKSSQAEGNLKTSSNFIRERGGKKKHRRKDTSSVDDIDADPKKRIQNLKNMLTSPDIYPYDVKPVNLPEEPKTRCAREYEDISIVDDSIKLDEVSRTQLLNKGPCGWRTKSEQQLPTKKTLVYLSEPDYPPETIAVRPGGRPCICRQNKDKKKVLTYNIGGLIRGKRDDPDVIDKKLLKKKKDQDDKKLQVIEGIIYHTPPPSPRRSDEYVPEYDLYTSPYDMCLSQRTDKNLKYFEQYSGPKGSMPKGTKQREPCECDEFVDTYGIQVDSQDTETEKATAEFEKNRQQLIEAIPPKERWDLALKDIGLIDYYTRCKDSMPCWLKCAKFNNVGCKLPIRKLQIKRPVCECKYERKILEHKEEKTKWKERRKRLKSMKKEPFMNIVDTSKPMVADTKLMISGVKRIPREDEYVDDVKYCITGVVENYTEEPPKPIVGGVQMATPIQTPEPSVEEIPCVCLHRHWSPTNIPPGPVPKPEEIRQAEEKKRRQAAEEAYKQIHAPEPVYDSHGTHSCKKTCDPNALSEDEDTEGRDSIMPRLSLKESRSRATGLPKQTKHQRKSITDDSKIKENLMKMAAQGFLFAKLPKCFLLPQLRYWLMYREGFALTDADKEKSLQRSLMMWNSLSAKKLSKLEPPSLNMTKFQLRNLTFSDIERMKEKIARNKAIFHSEVRKNRVVFARSLWNTMDYGKFPSLSFKRAFFSYMAGKEADGYVFKPWFRSDVRKGTT